MGKKFFITGAGGFVSGYFLEYLRQVEPEADILGVDIADAMPSAFPQIKYRQLNLKDADAVKALLAEFRPDYILHLASISSVSASWKNPPECFTNNTSILMNIAEAVRALQLPVRILSIGSSEEYGSRDASEMPLTEQFELRPGSPYAAAKAAQEMLGKLYADGFGIDFIMTRSFNHIGPRQKSIFVIPSFVQQLMNAAGQPGKHEMLVGNVDVVRDFLDVRDVVRAYYLLLKQGRRGEVYNVCSGKGVRLRDIIALLAELLSIQVELKVDPARLRPTENMVICGDNSKLKNETGWQPEIELKQTLINMIEYFQGEGK